MTDSRRERKKQETRQRIVLAAVRLFEEQGYEQTTVTQIAAAADVDPKTFFNYFGSKDEVLFTDFGSDFDVLFETIADRRPDESPGEVLRRSVRAFAALRRTRVPARDAGELSAISRLTMSTPALQAKGLYLQLEIQQRIAGELANAFPGELGPIDAAAMTGAVMGAIQQASLTSVQLGRSQKELWEAADRALEIATRGFTNNGEGIRP
ncbi:TetR/AcrR family transcriptional regulator [Flindersiella endophytica]